MKLVLFLAIVGLALCNDAFDNWAEVHGKSYKSWTERQFRQSVWTKNMNKILAHNVRHIKGEKSYNLAMNHYGDLTFEEFKEHKTCFGYSGANSTLKQKDGPNIPYSGSVFMPPVGAHNLPEEVDFRKLGFVTPIKDQGQCGSCWSFSTTGAMEGQLFRKTGKLPTLSEQQLVDCATSFGNYGCNGGLMDYAFEYIMTTSGLESEEDYPYTALDGTCQYDSTKGIGQATGFIDIPAGNETALTWALATNGPISIAIDASHSSLQFYSGGVYDEPECSPVELDHGVLTVGYGTLDGVPYFIVKNSWGSTWGMDGYILMSRNGQNQCGIASAASFPLV